MDASVVLFLYHVARIFQQGGGEEGGGAAVATSLLSSLCGIVIGVVIAGALLMGMFKKAGKPTWAAFVPLYNIVVMLEIVGRPVWWIILFFIPLVNIIVAIIFYIDIAKSFGKDTLYGIGLIVPLLNLILILMLSYGSAQYVGPAAKSGGAAAM